MDNENYYVYEYIHPIKLTPFYVGKGKGDRAYQHIKPNKINKEKTYLKRSCVNLCMELWGEPLIDFVGDGLTEKEALDLERLEIERWGRRDNGTGCLANLTDGGCGPSGVIMSDETRNKISLIGKGRKRSSEAIEKTRIAATGKRRSLEQRRRMSESRTGAPLTEAQIAGYASRKSKPPTEKMLKYFESMTGKKVVKSEKRAARDAEMAANKKVRVLKGKNPTGHPQSPETRAKIAEAMRGRVRTKEHSENLSKSLKKFAQTEEGIDTMKKVRAALAASVIAKREAKAEGMPTINREMKWH